jgi:hypothetical protein
LLRPGGDSAQLSVAGPFDWPNQQVEVLHALERLIQSYADQWLPRAALWPAPAEELLPAEIG